MDFTLLQMIILGIVQGITEWIPISSSAALVAVLSHFYNITDPATLVRVSLFFHFGTFLAALVYFRKDIKEILKNLFHYKYSDEKNKRTLRFLFLATLVSGLVGIVLLKTLGELTSFVDVTGKTVSLGVGMLLLVTSVLQLKIRRGGLKRERDLKGNDGILLGVMQGLAVLPGISRSGITVSTLLLKKFDDTTALRLSFLLSLPIVLLGNIVLNLGDFALSWSGLAGILASFIVGLLTIHGLMKATEKVNFGWFALVFAALMIASVFI